MYWNLEVVDAVGLVKVQVLDHRVSRDIHQGVHHPLPLYYKLDLQCVFALQIVCKELWGVQYRCYFWRLNQTSYSDFKIFFQTS